MHCTYLSMQPAKEQSIRQKIGSIFNLGTPRATPQPQKSYEEFGKQDHSTIFITEDVLRDLDRSVPTQQRVRAMKELHDIVSTKRLEEHAVKSIWLSIHDLIDPSQTTEVRHAALIFIKALIYGQFDDLGILRAHFFQVVKNHNVREDLQERFDILRVLTLDGKNIVHLEQEMGQFLLEWMPEVVSLGKSVNFLSLLVNFVHYNAAYLDQEVLVGLVQLCCLLANKSTLPNVISLCLDFLNAVVCYSSLPADSLHTFVITLCNTLNIERFSKKSLDVMLRLLGTHLGRSAIYAMCSLIQERSESQEALLLRGAVFYISMSMWGVRRVNLDLSFASILPSIKQAVLSDHTIVVYEVSLSLTRLIRAHALQLHPLEWEAVYDIISAIQGHVSHLQERTREPSSLPTNSLGQCLRDLFLSIEQLYEQGVCIGSPDVFFGLVENSLDAMPVQSVLILLSYRTCMIDSTEPHWLTTILGFMDKFYRHETRTAVRVEALNYLGKFVGDNSFTHEAELMETVVLPLLEPISQESDEVVRSTGAQLLVRLLSVTEPQWGTQLLAILTSILQAGMLAVSTAKREKFRESPGLPDSRAAVFGLTETFKKKLQSSSPIAAQVFSLLVALILQHYDEKCFLPTACEMRAEIFECILRLRCNELGQLGYQDNESVQFSPFFICHTERVATPTDHTPTVLDYKSAFNAILVCLEREQQREVLVQVLCDLVPLLQDRTLTLSSMPDLSMLTIHLCDLTTDHTHQPHPHSTSWSKTDVPLHVYPVLAVLTAYPSHMDRRAQESLVCCLEAGLVSKAAQTCVSSLGLCALELQPTMKRLLPRVLYRLGQIAATPTMAVPVLDFLSALIPVPSLYRGFVDQEYLSVFAIALPYTNNQKYGPYVIALAHRVVAQWFVSCRLQYRATVARFITKHLSTDLTALSLPVTREVGVGAELVEVCKDMMARYTYSNISALPSRSSGAEFLLDNGLSKTWSVGSSLVTITTNRGKDGSCKRCSSVNNTPPDDKHGYHGNSVDDSSLCSCLCKGWAEVLIRRPTGNVSWVMRLQNTLEPLASFHSDSGWGLSDSGHGLLDIHRPTEDEIEHGVVSPLLHVTTSIRDDGGGVRGGAALVEEENPYKQGREGVTPEAGVSSDGVTPEAGEGETTETSDSDKPPDGQGQSLPLNADSTQTIQDNTSPISKQTVTDPAPDNGEVPSNYPSDTSEPVNHDSDQIPSIQNDLSPDMSPTKAASQSPRESGAVAIPRTIQSSSYPAMASLEHLPPLLSYDKEDECGRSPCLHDESLSEEDQLSLYASLSKLTTSQEPPESRESDTPTGSSSSDSDSVDMSDVVVLSWKQESVPKSIPRLKTKSQSLPEEGSSPLSLVSELPPPHPPTAFTPSPGPLRRQSAPSTPLDVSPAQRRKKMVYTHPTPFSVPFQTGVGTHQGVESEEYYDPSFVFLQLYQNCVIGQPLHSPILLPSNEVIDRAVKMLDHIPPYETHKIGVIYLAPGQSSEAEILSNTYGSSRYLEFLQGLGSLLRLRDTPPGMIYLGGLDRSGTDGNSTYYYHDNTSQVVFHVATLMPTNLTSDPQCSCKKLHIGNDFVTIVYNDSGSKYNFGTIKGQFNFAEVVIEPRPGGMNRLLVQGKKELRTLLLTTGSSLFISDSQLPVFVRQKALQADLASHVHVSETTAAVTEHYLTNWLGRLRQIKKIRDKCCHDDTAGNRTAPPTDFTDFT